MAVALVDHLGAAMGAAVEQHLHRTITMAHHDDRLAAEIGGDEVAGIGRLAFVADEQPGAAENARHFQVEQVRVGVNAPVHAARLDELGDLVGVAVAHRPLFRRLVRAVLHLRVDELQR